MKERVSHCSNRQNHRHNNLSPRIHLQIPNQEHRNDTQCPICCTRNRRIDISRINGDGRVDTGPFSAGVLRPEVSGRSALKDEEEEVECAVNLDHGDGRPDDDFVDSRYGDAEEENGNAEL